MKHLGTLSQYCLETSGDSQPAACWLDQYQRQMWSKADSGGPKDVVVWKEPNLEKGAHRTAELSFN